MSEIVVAIGESEKTILSAGLEAVLHGIDGVRIALHFCSEEALVRELTKDNIHVVFMVLRDANDFHDEFIKKIRLRWPRLPLVAVAPQPTREMLFKVIKDGANGFLSGDATEREILEAVYSVRNGHDFFCASVTSLMISDYTNALRRDQKPAMKGIEMLSQRELKILELWGEGKTNPEIGDTLFISTRTVESHKNHIMQKLKVRTTVDLLKVAIRNNIISL